MIKYISKVRYKARKRMFGLFLDMCKPSEVDKILDMGVTPDESQKESNFFEEFYPYKHNIVAASIEDARFLEKKYKGLKFVRVFENKPFPFADNEFDILFCNAVIEHVGSRKEQQFFLNECIRVSKKIYITTPNRWFIFETHSAIPVLHWLPMKVFRGILKFLGNDFLSKEKNLNLFTRKDIENMLKVSPHLNFSGGGGTRCTALRPFFGPLT